MATGTVENASVVENAAVYKIVQRYISAIPITESFADDAKKDLARLLTEDIAKCLSNNLLKERLEILYDYEKKYLELTKAYKEEIKFAATLQEDIRKERSKFFSEVLQDVHKTLEEVKMDKKEIDLWISELVTSYTKSLDISSELSKDHVLDMMGILRDTSRSSIAKITDVQVKNAQGDKIEP
jgi:hypothetical protein